MQFAILLNFLSRWVKWLNLLLGKAQTKRGAFYYRQHRLWKCEKVKANAEGQWWQSLDLLPALTSKWFHIKMQGGIIHFMENGGQKDTFFYSYEYCTADVQQNKRIPVYNCSLAQFRSKSWVYSKHRLCLFTCMSGHYPLSPLCPLRAQMEM